MKKFTETLGRHLISLGGVLINAFVFMKLWKWLIASSFDVITLSYLQALGLSYFMSFVQFRIMPRDMRDIESLNPQQICIYELKQIVCILVLFGIGYIISLFV